MGKINELLESIDAEAFRHAVPLQLRFNDIDVLGHVNNNAQLALFDVGKTSFDKEVRGVVRDWDKVDTMIVNINCTFMQQIHFTDPMEVRTRVKKVGGKSYVLQQILRNTATGAICSLSESVMVSIDYESKQTREIPAGFASRLREWM